MTNEQLATYVETLAKLLEYNCLLMEERLERITANLADDNPDVRNLGLAELQTPVCINMFTNEPSGLGIMKELWSHVAFLNDIINDLQTSEE